MKGREEDGHRSGMRWNPHSRRSDQTKDGADQPEERHGAAFDADEFPDLDELLQEASLELPSMDAERMNRRVMDRIYEESPWLLPGETKTYASQHRFRSRAAIWIAALLAVFFVSFVYLAGWGVPERPQGASQNVPAGVIVQPLTVGASGSDSVDSTTDEDQSSERGIVEPLFAQIGPTHPQYWMFLSLTGMGLALLALTRLATMRK
ncbi:hypothetical protein B9G55_03430 [Saccharibacillus sp. O16]|nr:hypothetical protein B9G55_03430 [Saccharibacillus sp. O16]